MNRIKKEFRRKGLKLECDYEHLPYYIKGQSCFDVGNICIESVAVKSETATAVVITNTMVEIITMGRDGQLTSEWD